MGTDERLIVDPIIAKLILFKPQTIQLIDNKPFFITETFENGPPILRLGLNNMFDIVCDALISYSITIKNSLVEFNKTIESPRFSVKVLTDKYGLEPLNLSKNILYQFELTNSEHMASPPQLPIKPDNLKMRQYPRLKRNSPIQPKMLSTQSPPSSPAPELTNSENLVYAPQLPIKTDDVKIRLIPKVKKNSQTLPKKLETQSHSQTFNNILHMTPPSSPPPEPPNYELFQQKHNKIYGLENRMENFECCSFRYESPRTSTKFKFNCWSYKSTSFPKSPSYGSNNSICQITKFPFNEDKISKQQASKIQDDHMIALPGMEELSSGKFPNLRPTGRKRISNNYV